MASYRHDPSPRCQKCQAATLAEELTFSAAGEQLCRRCAACDVVAAAEQLERRHGMVRRCSRCPEGTMRGHEKREVRETRGWRLAGSTSQEYDVDWSYEFHCTKCGRRLTFMPGPILLLAAAATVALAWIVRDEPPWVSVAPAALGLWVIYEVAKRLRNPTIRTD